MNFEIPRGWQIAVTAALIVALLYELAELVKGETVAT